MRLSTLWTVSMILTSFLCSAQKLHPKITTDIKDERIPNLLGQWFLKSSKVESTTFDFTREVNDSADLKINFNENGNFVLKNKYNKENPTKISLWFLVEDKLYLETYAEKGLCNVYTIKIISDTLLSYTYYKTKNIYEGFLCGDQRTYNWTDVSPKFGKKKKDFDNYFSTNLNFSEQSKTIDSDCIIEFTINCNGEICEVQPYIKKNTELEKNIIALLRQMPNWTPATMKGKTVNFSKKYKFSYLSGQLKILEE